MLVRSTLPAAVVALVLACLFSMGTANPRMYPSSTQSTLDVHTVPVQMKRPVRASSVGRNAMPLNLRREQQKALYKLALTRVLLRAL